MLNTPNTGRRVLLVDDEPSILDLFRHLLTDAGYAVECASNGREAEQCLERRSFDVIVSDISMPEMGGVELLRAVRSRDLDVPVVLVTGLPEVASAIEAVEHGAMRYLVKPVRREDHLEVVDYGYRLHALTKVKREALVHFGKNSANPADKAGLDAAFNRAMDATWMAFQPIVRLSRREVYAYEALVRSTEPALPDPKSLFRAAEALGRVVPLGRKIRGLIADVLPDLDAAVPVFVNLHPVELNDDALFEDDASISAHAGRIVLEISEQKPLSEVVGLQKRVARLREMGFGIAVDDLGAGYAGLGSFVHLSPDVAKLDHAMVRNIDADPTKQKLAASMLRLCADIGVSIIAEGVETRAELETLEQLGMDFVQGNFFAHPGKAFPLVDKAAFELAGNRFLPL